MYDLMRGHEKLEQLMGRVFILKRYMKVTWKNCLKTIPDQSYLQKKAYRLKTSQLMENEANTSNAILLIKKIKS